MIVYHKSHVGYSHLRRGKGCEDFSQSYIDETRSAIAVADGHGGALYIRSDRGSKFACQAVLDIFKGIKRIEGIFPQKLKLQILCAWNALVETDYGRHPFSEEELSSLDEDGRETLLSKPEKAYGTTLLGALCLGDRFLVVHIGDGESLIYKDGKVSPCFEEEEDEPVANITYSMCGDDVLSHMNVTHFPCDYADFVLLCTDGAANPYRSYENLVSSFMEPVVRELSTENGPKNVDAFVETLAEKTGVGDDVSVAALGLGPIDINRLTGGKPKRKTFRLRRYAKVA